MIKNLLIIHFLSIAFSYSQQYGTYEDYYTISVDRCPDYDCVEHLICSSENDIKKNKGKIEGVSKYAKGKLIYSKWTVAGYETFYNYDSLGRICTISQKSTRKYNSFNEILVEFSYKDGKVTGSTWRRDTLYNGRYVFTYDKYGRITKEKSFSKYGKDSLQYLYKQGGKDSKSFTLMDSNNDTLEICEYDTINLFFKVLYFGQHRVVQSWSEKINEKKQRISSVMGEFPIVGNAEIEESITINFITPYNMIEKVVKSTVGKKKKKTFYRVAQPCR